MTENKTPTTPAYRGDPWPTSPVPCIAYPWAPKFVAALQGVLGEQVPLVGGVDASPSHVVLVDCREVVEGMAIARRRYPAQPIVAVIDAPETATIVALLGARADGVISIAEPLASWLECLNVVRGGARWLGGPGLQVNLEQKSTSYTISKSERHDGDVTMRTELFVRSRVADKVG